MRALLAEIFGELLLRVFAYPIAYVLKTLLKGLGFAWLALRYWDKEKRSSHLKLAYHGDYTKAGNEALLYSLVGMLAVGISLCVYKGSLPSF
jgi:hypothetical protein